MTENDEYYYAWGGTLPDPDFNKEWMKTLPLFEEKWLETLLDIVDNDVDKMIKLLQILEEYKEKIIIDPTYMQSIMQNRKNYTGDYVRKEFSLYTKEHPNKKKMEQIDGLADELGITAKAVEKHIYKK